jgi:hypothetical protein
MLNFGLRDPDSVLPQDIYHGQKQHFKKLGFLPWYKYECWFTLCFWNIPHHHVLPVVKYKARVIMNLTIGRSQGI